MTATSQLFPGAAEADGGTLTYTVLDVFTAEPLAGNPLAVFLDGRGLTGDEMQALARELRLSESVFLLPADGPGDVRLRIFTPSTELPFAGHPVLGAAFVAAEALGTDSVTLETGNGPVPLDMTREGNRLVFGRMSQPIPVVSPFGATSELFAALGVSGSQLPVETYDNGPKHVLVMLGSAAEVAALDPNFYALGKLGDYGISCFARDGLEWKTRMFAAAVGVPEDPATGSAAGPLALHLARHEVIPFGEEIVIHQGTEIWRPSTLHATAFGSPEGATRVEVGGAAVVVAQGHYLARSARST